MKSEHTQSYISIASDVLVWKHSKTCIADPLIARTVYFYDIAQYTVYLCDVAH